MKTVRPWWRAADVGLLFAATGPGPSTATESTIHSSLCPPFGVKYEVNQVISAEQNQIICKNQTDKMVQLNSKNSFFSFLLHFLFFSILHLFSSFLLNLLA